MAPVEIKTHDLVFFSDFLRETTGISFDESNWLGLKISLKERMRLTAIEEADRYLSRLKDDPLELEELLAMVTVPETYFYRDRRQFDALKEVVLPEIIKRKSLSQIARPHIKIVSCGCSIGPEPYSIAIAILEAGLIEKAQFEIIAFDINKQAISRARQGIYSKYYFREHEIDLSKYFHLKGNTFILKNEIKNFVKFYQANLFDLTKADFDMKDADVIFVRNVLIYFNEEHISKAIEIISQNLAKEGHLFLGTAESLLRRTTAFNLQEIGQAFVWRPKGVLLKESPKKDVLFSVLRDIEQKEEIAFEPAAAFESPVLKPLHVVIPEPARDELHYENAMGYYKIKLFEKAEEEFQAQLAIIPDHLASLVGLAKVYADTGKDQLALEVCQKAVQMDNLIADIYFIMGLIAFKQKKLGEAITHFKKTIYCNENHFVAQYYLALVYKEQGQVQKANHQFRIAAHMIDDLGEGGLNKELVGHSGNYIVSLCVDNIV